jgi:molecular chaperone Hsp33
VPTRLWIAADETRAVGLLLQRLPDEGGLVQADAPRDSDGWNRLQKLAETVTRDELLGLDPGRVLHRLFWQESLHGFEQREPRFACSCSHEKVASMLRMLGRDEVDSILAECGSVSVRCEFCNTPYEFDAIDCARLFVSGPQVPGSQSRH